MVAATATTFFITLQMKTKTELPEAKSINTSVTRKVTVKIKDDCPIHLSQTDFKPLFTPLNTNQSISPKIPLDCSIFQSMYNWNQSCEEKNQEDEKPKLLGVSDLRHIDQNASLCHTYSLILNLPLHLVGAQILFT